MDLIIFHSPIICELNSSSIAYTWADEDELRYLNSENNENQVSGRNSCTNLVEAFYPLYLGDSIEFTPRRHSGSMTRLVENINDSRWRYTDLNNDGRYNFVIANQRTDSINVFLGFDYTKFQNQETYSVENITGPYDVVVHDFNQEDCVDIAVVFSKTDNLVILLGKGDDSFVVSMSYHTGENTVPSMITVNDGNNDRQKHIIVVNCGTNTISVFLSHGNGIFDPMILSSTGADSVPYFEAIADVDNDGIIDAVSTNSGSNTTGILLGHNNGSLTLLTTYPTGDSSAPTAVVVNDLNNDGFLDFFVCNFDTSNIGIFLGNGNASFSTQVTYSTCYRGCPIWIAINDFNNDSKSDIAVSIFNNDYMSVFLGYGNGSVGNAVQYSAGDGTFLFVAAGDFNNDKPNGREAFGGMNKYKTGGGSDPHSIAISDLNNNGWMDGVVANYRTDSLGILYGSRNGILNNMVTYSTGINAGPYSLGVSDFNNHSRPDITVTNSLANTIAIFLADQNGTFVLTSTYSAGDRSIPYTVAVTDLNNDHKSDIIVTNSGTSNILVLYGNGNDTFTNETPYPLGYGYLPYSLAVNDLNQDGWMDGYGDCML
ncbi:unnamed protein product [Adineta ricciae]|uniref:VCBS repeat-containing protein n=1 Tax=Adineta ricciae TaxID=249248 RepID=A0A815WLV1_ADIRI|nr:unnamed protein product [Adineta ricciae]